MDCKPTAPDQTRKADPQTAKRLKFLAALLAVLALLLLASGGALYSQSIPRAPQTSIQNRTMWCWATTAKLLGVRYNSRYSIATPMPEGAVPVITSSAGLRTQYAGLTANGDYTIDAGQQAVVKTVMGSDVNQPGSRAQTFAAMQYVTGGHALPQNRGAYNDGSVLRAVWDDVQAVLDSRLSVIANIYSPGSGVGHSLVLSGFDRKTGLYTLYDVWDGSTILVTKKQLLTDGFDTSYGTVPVTWVYYIINPLDPPKLYVYRMPGTPGQEPPVGEADTGYTGPYLLSDFTVLTPRAGLAVVTGIAPRSCVVYTSINGGGYYATRSDDTGHYSQQLNQKLAAGDVVRIFCEDDDGNVTELKLLTIR